MSMSLASDLCYFPARVFEFLRASWLLPSGSFFASPLLGTSERLRCVLKDRHVGSELFLKIFTTPLDDSLLLAAANALGESRDGEKADWISAYVHAPPFNETTTNVPNRGTIFTGGHLARFISLSFNEFLPPWRGRACVLMRNDRNTRIGNSRFVDLASSRRFSS